MFKGKAASEQIGGDERTGSAHAETAVDKHFFAKIDRFIEPFKPFFQILHGRCRFIRDGQPEDLETGVLLQLVQIAVFTAKVDNGVDTLRLETVKVVIGHRGAAGGDVFGDPVERVR